MQKTAKISPISKSYKVNLTGGFGEIEQEVSRGSDFVPWGQGGVKVRARPATVSIVEAFLWGYVPEDHENGEEKQAPFAAAFFQNLRRCKQRKITF